MPSFDKRTINPMISLKHGNKGFSEEFWVAITGEITFFTFFNLYLISIGVDNKYSYIWRKPILHLISAVFKRISLSSWCGWGCGVVQRKILLAFGSFSSVCFGSFFSDYFIYFLFSNVSRSCKFSSSIFFFSFD